MHTSPVSTAAPVAPRAGTPAIRYEIQGLRAVAVIGVLLFHLWPLRLPGGYVGVDVFFVVSGFLITDHLVREFERRGTVSLPAFWARRVRRLLPASLLVLAVTAVAVWLWVPLTRWAQFGAEIIASAFYVQNWALAAQSVDYMALSNVKSPVQHFWTLSVEEQFYLVWPVLLLAGWGAARLLRRRPLRGITAIIAAATAASFAASILLTWSSPDVAYFSTFTRGWEFGVGALLALSLRRLPRPLQGGWASAGSWAGFAMIAAAMILFTGQTPFPSYTAALPALGTALVIAAGSPAGRGAPTALFRWRPVQLVGDVSYGTYLWHWPVIVIVPYAVGHPLNTLECIVIFIVSILLGWLSKVLVEDPARSSRWLAGGRPRRSLLAAAAGMLAVTASAAPLALATVPPPPVIPAAVPSCVGASTMVDPACGDPLAVPLLAPLESFSGDLPPQEIRECELTVELVTYRRCDLVAAAAESAPRIAFVGDSHATRWAEAFERAAGDADWGLTTYLVSGCPLITREPLGGPWGYEPQGAQLCPVPTDAVLNEIKADPAITDVVFTNRTRLYVTDDAEDHPLTSPQVAATIDELQAAGKNVIVLPDPPEMHEVPVMGAASAVDCLLAANEDPARCSLSRDAAEFADPMRAGAALAGASVLDLTDLFCTETACHARVGGLVVYTDDNHLTRSFAASLSDILEDRLTPLVGARS